MAQGNYDHPSYLTRQQLFPPKTVAGSVTTNTLLAPPPVSNLRIRAVGLTAITTASLSSTYIFQLGTASVGQIIISTASIGQVLVSSDLNVTMVAGVGAVPFVLKNSADTASSFYPVIEAYLDPLATWTGPNN
jgi:hypothetical protein